MNISASTAITCQESGCSYNCRTIRQFWIHLTTDHGMKIEVQSLRLKTTEGMFYHTGTLECHCWPAHTVASHATLVVKLAWFSDLLIPAFVACSTTASDKRWDEKALEQCYSSTQWKPSTADTCMIP